MEHSSLYYNWLKNEKYALKNIRKFILNKGKITSFTKIDLFCFLKTKYQSYIEKYLLKENIDYLFSVFNDDEMKKYMKESKIVTEDLFLETIKRLPERKNLLKMLSKEEDFHDLFFIHLETVLKKITDLQEPNILEYILPETLCLILLNPNKSYYYKIILKEVISSEFYMEEIFKNINIETIKTLKYLKDSPYYEKTYLKYKEQLLAIILDNYYFRMALKKAQNDNQEDIIKTIFIIIEDITRLAQKDIYDIKYFNRGSYSIVYKIGQYIIKIGKERIQNEIPLDIDMLYPICRKYIKELNLFIEITTLGQNEEITMEDVYQLFKRKREEGKCWIDAKEENVVKLIQDNGSYPFTVEPETIGFIGEKKKEQKKRGECVICDTDLLYEENKVPWDIIKHTCSSAVIKNYNKLEDRYQKEKKQYQRQRKKD